MLFNSLEFIYLFLPLTLGLFYLSSRFRLLTVSKWILLSASLLFYAYWRFWYFLLIIFKILTNYFLAVALEKRRTKPVLWFGIIFNLSILCYFKYWNFFIDVLSPVTSFERFSVHYAIPLGISFYTFTQLTYLVDLYKGKTRYYGLMPYSLFVVFFPHLIAGPIVHYSQMMPQFDQVKTYVARHKNFFSGTFFFLAGLFQKVVIADSLAPIANTGFLNAPLLGITEAWGALLAYSLQLYFDFAGYSNMAIGLALLFNIRFPMNFNSPYQSESLIEFWRRWHMTLSHFLREYIYFPLGGNRKGTFKTCTNLLITMLIGGFWHGAGWTFIIWGAYHGILLVINHLSQSSGLKPPVWLGRIITFILVCYGWVFFRADNMAQVWHMTQGLVGLHGFHLTDTYFLWKDQVVMIAAALALALFAPNTEFWAKKIAPNLQWGLIFGTLFMANLLFLNRESAFLYFQF